MEAFHGEQAARLETEHGGWVQTGSPAGPWQHLIMNTFNNRDLHNLASVYLAGF